MLLELVLAGRLDLRADGRKNEVVVIDPSPLGDPILDGALRIVRDRVPMDPVSAIGKVGVKLRDRLYEGLASRGIVRREKGKLLLVFPITSWPATDSRHEDALRRELTDVLRRKGEASPRSASVIALLSAADLLTLVVDKPELKAAKARGREIAEGNWASDSVKQAIQNAQAAIAAAVMVSTTAVVIAGAN